MKKHLIRLGSASAMFGLVLGTAAVAGASTGTIDTTGPDSYNKIEVENSLRLKVDNDNKVRLTNNNPQTAKTGEAEVEHNTTGGDARSGDASNESELNASVTFKNNNGGFGNLFEGMEGDDGTIDTTGPDSYNKIEFENKAYVRVENENRVYVTNNNSQYARSGEAEVEGNTTGGDATSGDAANSSSATFEVNITN